MNNGRQQILDWIEQDRERLVEVLQGFIRCDDSNPPGDTRKGAAFVTGLLERERLPYRVIAPQPDMPNILGSFEGARPGRHLVLNGHIDVFPAGDAALWSRDPFCGDIVDGRIYGRGGVDMKCGTTASIFTYAYLHRLREHLSGRLTLTVVSDEETGGVWGTGYLIENHPDEVLGDCVLNGEPSSPYTVRFGEKALFWQTFRVKTPGAHGAYWHASKSATKIAAHVIVELEKLDDLQPETPEALARILAQPDTQAAIENGLGKGAMGVIQKLTVNVGVIHGGVKVNMMPGECVFEVCIRLPVGITRDDVRRDVRRILERYPEVTVTEAASNRHDATWCDPEGEMLKLVQKNAEALNGIRPAATTTLGGTDCRFWRARGVPAYVFGPSPGGMGVPNEAVSIDEFFHVLKTHALSAYDYLTAG